MGYLRLWDSGCGLGIRVIRDDELGCHFSKGLGLLVRVQ